jgi:membrane associated rhomboid family serine protease
VFPVRDLNPTRAFPLVTLALIAANIAVFVFWQPHGSAEDETRFVFANAAVACEVTSGHPLTANQIQSDNCKDARPSPEVFPDKQIELSVLVSMFLHGGTLHLLGNMWFLWLFGDNVEEAYGSLRFLLMYVAAGIVAALGFIAMHPESTTPLIGASGAIAGVLGAYLILFPGRMVISVVVFTLLPVPAFIFLGLWFVLQFAVADPGIAWEAHVSGFLFGMALSLLFRSPLLGRVRRLHRPRFDAYS